MRHLDKAIGLIFSIVLAAPGIAANAAQGGADKPTPTRLNLHVEALPEPAKAPEVANLAIEGYSPVSYFEKNLPEKGKPEFQSSYEGKVYYLASAEQLATFEADPKHYAPVFGEYCPYSLALGRRVAIDPTRFEIVQGQLLLFHNSAELDALSEWDKDKDPNQLLKRAKAEYTLFRF
jgi:YHS domain-containing protein